MSTFFLKTLGIQKWFKHQPTHELNNGKTVTYDMACLWCYQHSAGNSPGSHDHSQPSGQPTSASASSKALFTSTQCSWILPLPAVPRQNSAIARLIKWNAIQFGAARDHALSCDAKPRDHWVYVAMELEKHACTITCMYVYVVNLFFQYTQSIYMYCVTVLYVIMENESVK